MSDFDFLIGTYHVVLKIKGEDGSWTEFPGINRGSRHLDGQSVVDELTATTPDGRLINFLDVHVYDPSTQEWTNAIHSRGATPDWSLYRGRFTDGIGVFEKPGERHTWHDITATTVGFKQEVSTDDGQTWETDFVATLTRAIE